MHWDPFLMIFFLGLAIACYTETKTGLIKNWTTVPLFFCGLVYVLVGSDNPTSDLGLSIIASIVTGFFFINGMMHYGFGDLKLCMALGTWMVGLNVLIPCLFFITFARLFVGILARVIHGIRNPRLALASIKVELKRGPGVIDVAAAPGAYTISLAAILSVFYGPSLQSILERVALICGF